MMSICFREFKNLFKSVKSVIFIAILCGVTLLIAQFFKGYQNQLSEFGLGNAYAAGLFLIILLLGPLFVISLSHDIINQETKSRTMRFLVTKISRDKIILGKFAGVTLFWSCCLCISLLLIIPFSHEFYFMKLIESIIFITYFIALALLLSTIINKPSLSMFLGIILSVIIPIIGLWSMITDNNVTITLISYFTPYYYFGESDKEFLIYFVPVLSAILFLGSVLLFRKKEC
ncbi:ABC transporter permease subunit [Priestia megaterium]